MITKEQTKSGEIKNERKMKRFLITKKKHNEMNETVSGIESLKKKP